MDDCDLSFVAGRLQVDFSRRGKLIQSRVLDVEAVERLADQLEGFDEADTTLEGGVALERGHARRVSQQLRALASVLRVARELWAEDQEPHAVARRARGRARTVKARRSP